MKEDTARSIVQIKTGISVRNREEQIRACQESGADCHRNGPAGPLFPASERHNPRPDVVVIPSQNADEPL